MQNEKALKDLETIKEFLEEGKARLVDNGFYFIYWGLAIPLNTALFYLLMFRGAPVPVLTWFWPVSIPVHTFITMIIAKGSTDKKVRKDFLSRINGMFWMGILFTFLVLIGIFMFMQQEINPTIMSYIALLLGLAYWVHGSMLKLNWLAFQGFIWWTAAIIISRLGWNGASWLLSATTFVCSFGTGMILRFQKGRN